MANQTKLEQGRAAKAFDSAKEGKMLGGGPKADKKTGKMVDSKEAKEYKAYSKKIPMLIKTNGLGNTLSFMISKSKSKVAYSLLYNQIHARLQSKELDYLPINEKELVEQIINLDSSMYRLVTVEILAFFNWLRRFSDGLIEGDGGGDD